MQTRDVKQVFVQVDHGNESEMYRITAVGESHFYARPRLSMFPQRFYWDDGHSDTKPGLDVCDNERNNVRAIIACGWTPDAPWPEVTDD